MYVCLVLSVELCVHCTDEGHCGVAKFGKKLSEVVRVNSTDYTPRRRSIHDL